MPLVSRTLLLTTLAMLAFAANSVFARLALIEGDIGAGSFTLIRLISGALVLVLLVRGGMKRTPSGSWSGAVSLLTYAGFFSYAYISLPTGTGAIILFAVVQLTMLGWGLIVGERLSSLRWAGLTGALMGLIWLVSPGIDAPDPLGAIAMALAGLGWGAYSLLGRGRGDSTAMTAGNFVRASLLGLLILGTVLLTSPEDQPTYNGVLFAVLSGAVTSGLGYAIWYMALKGLSATRAGIAQLSVPALAAIGGVLFLSEAITLRFALASTLILGGVAMAVLTTRASSRKAS